MRQYSVTDGTKQSLTSWWNPWFETSKSNKKSAWKTTWVGRWRGFHIIVTAKERERESERARHLTNDRLWGHAVSPPSRKWDGRAVAGKWWKGIKERDGHIECLSLSLSAVLADWIGCSLSSFYRKREARLGLFSTGQEVKSTCQSLLVKPSINWMNATENQINNRRGRKNLSGEKSDRFPGRESVTEGVVVAKRTLTPANEYRWRK